MMTDADLQDIDALLRRASHAFPYPQTPPIAQAIAVRIRATERAAGPVHGFRHLIAARLARTMAALMLALLAIAAVALAVPQSRDALADFFGLSSVRVDREPFVGELPPVLHPESFAQPSTVNEAQAVFGSSLRFPTVEGIRLEPDAVYIFDANSTAPTPILVYMDEGFDLYQRRGGFFGKGGPDPSLIHEIEFDGLPALWIEEGGHIAESYDESGRLLVESVRTVDRATLVWERAGVTYRLETSLSQGEAIGVARSLR